MEWVTFQNYINRNLTLQAPLKTDRDIEDYVHHLVQIIQQAAWYSTTHPVHTKPKTSVPRLSKRKYLTKEDYAEDGNTPGPRKIRQT